MIAGGTDIPILCIGSKHVNEFSKAYTEHLEKEARNQRK